MADSPDPDPSTTSASPQREAAPRSAAKARPTLHATGPGPGKHVTWSPRLAAVSTRLAAGDPYFAPGSPQLADSGPPPADGKPPPAKGPTKIRVIEVRRNLADPATAGQEELGILLAAARETPQLINSAAALNAFLDIARILQGPLSPFLAERASTEAQADTTLDAILVRDLLANPAVRPIITARGAAATAERETRAELAQHAGGVHTRAATRARAIDESGHDIAIAAEEPVTVGGFAVDPRAAGDLVAGALGSGANLGLDAYAESGAFSAAVFAARGPVRPPEYEVAADGQGGLQGRLRRRGFEVSLQARGAHSPAAALIRQTRAAVNFYLSGAAAATVLARIAAAVHGLPGAPPELLAALGPRSDVLAADGGVVVAAAVGPAPGAEARGWRDADAAARLRYLLGRLAKSEPIAADDPATWVYDLSPLNDLFRAGALGVYLYALTEGRESARLDAFLERAATRHLKASQLGEISQRAIVASARARLYVTIIEDKFGSARGHAVLDALRTAVGSRARGAPGGSLALPSDSVQVDDPEAVLALLSKREREVVETEYDNRRKEWEASVGNKCPHVRIARRLRAATSAEEALKALRELEKYFAPAAPRKKGRADDAELAKDDTPGWLMCRSCGFRALCPHARDRVSMEARRAPYDELRTRLLKYAVRVRSAGDADSYTYYCRICSERLAEIVEEDRAAEALGRFGDLDAGLRTKIWTVALGAARNVRFPTPTDERQFASVVALVVYPLLMAAEAAVAQKGRRRKAASRDAPATGADDDAEEIDPRTQLYIVIFVYAYILDLIQTSQGARSQSRVDTEVGFAGVKAGAKASAYAERMLRLIAEEHRGLISQIEDISAEFLKARFTEAYRLVRGEGGAGLQVANPEEELAFQTTTVDPIYRYAATAARVAGDLPVARPAGPAEARREFETLLGAGLTDIVKLARESARDPALAPLYLRRTGVEVPPGGALEFLVKDPRVNLYAKLYEPGAKAAGPEALKAFRAVAAAAEAPANGIRYWIGAGEPGGHDLAAAKRRGPGKPNKHPAAARARNRGKARASQSLEARPEDSLALAERGAFFEGYRLFAEYTKGLVSQEALDAYHKELAAYRRCEDGLRVARALASIKPYYDFGFVRSQQFVPVQVPITAIYDEDGRRHDWGRKVTYYYRSGDGRAPKGAKGPQASADGEVEIKGGPAGVKAARDDGSLTPEMVLVDLGCSVCGVRASAVGELDPAKVEQSVRAASEIDSFFVFYESRCPAGELHDWAGAAGGAQSCSRCGLAAAVLKEVASGQSTKSKAARAYYDKYSARFAAERREVREAAASLAPAAAKRGDDPAGRSRDTEDGRQPAPDAAAGPRKADQEAAAWKPDYTLIVRAAELAGVTPATIEAIGSMEGREYADIVEGRGVPPAPSAPSDPRIFTADAEVRLFLADYSVLRNAGRFAKLPPAAADLLAAAGVPKHEYGTLPRVLPDVSGGYHAVFAAVARVRSPADAYAFAIQSLCRMALDVAGGGVDAAAPSNVAPEWAGRLGSAFAKKELETILRGQKLFSKPGTFSWAIFETGDDPTGLAEQAGDVGEDVLEELLGAEGEEAADDPFSGENMDYDTSEGNPNNEPE